MGKGGDIQEIKGHGGCDFSEMGRGSEIDSEREVVEAECKYWDSVGETLVWLVVRVTIFNGKWWGWMQREIRRVLEHVWVIVVEKYLKCTLRLEIEYDIGRWKGIYDGTRVGLANSRKEVVDLQFDIGDSMFDWYLRGQGILRCAVSGPNVTSLRVDVGSRLPEDVPSILLWHSYL